jgi:hypothetical protein
MIRVLVDADVIHRRDAEDTEKTCYMQDEFRCLSWGTELFFYQELSLRTLRLCGENS